MGDDGGFGLERYSGEVGDVDEGTRVGFYTQRAPAVNSVAVEKTSSKLSWIIDDGGGYQGVEGLCLGG